MKGYSTDKRLKKKTLKLWNVFIEVSSWNLLWSPCQVSGKQRLLTSWLNRDQSTCHIENLKQAPFGSSLGHSVCVEERKHVPKTPFNHIVHVKNHLLLHVVFRSDTRKNLHVLISDTFSGSFPLYTSQFSL